MTAVRVYPTIDRSSYIVERPLQHSMKHDTTHPSADTSAKGFSPGFAALGLEAALLTTLDTLGL